MSDGSAHEQTINIHIGQIINEEHSNSDITAHAERTKMLKNTSERIDIILQQKNYPPIAIENEIDKIADPDATNRLGSDVEKMGRINIVVALTTHDRFRNYSNDELKDKLRTADDFKFAIYINNEDEQQKSNKNNVRRYPNIGYMCGTILDMLYAIHAAKSEIFSTDKLANEAKIAIGISANNLLTEQTTVTANNIIEYMGIHIDDDDPVKSQKIKKQTISMAMTVISNALLFHDYIASSIPQVKSLNQLMDENSIVPQADLLEIWRHITTDIDYVAVLEIAKDLVMMIPANHYHSVIDELIKLNLKLMRKDALVQHDLFGMLFQKMISDRDFLGANYTLPESAALLTSLAMDKQWWTNVENVKTSRIGDFSCGTGSLLLATYREIERNQYTSNSEVTLPEIHQHLIEKSFYGYDVVPSAVHITATSIAGMYPTKTFKETNFRVFRLGDNDMNDLSLGALDLLGDLSQAKLPNKAKTLSGTVESKSVWLEKVSEGTFDMVIMNPPYTRSAHQKGTKTKSNPAFASYNIPEKVQIEMGLKLKTISKWSCANGYAGLGSNFFAIADRMIKINGILAMVLPSVSMVGDSWKNVREILAKCYENIIVVGISCVSGKHGIESNFSSDTEMSEILLIAKKKYNFPRIIPKKKSKTKQKNAPIFKMDFQRTEPDEPQMAMFVTLNKRPANALTSKLIADYIKKQSNDNEYDIKIGEDNMGFVSHAPFTIFGIKPVGATLSNLYNIAKNISSGTLEVLGNTTISLPICKITDFAIIGKYHLNIKQFFKHNQGFKTSSNFHSLWWRNANTQKSIILQPDAHLIAKNDQKLNAKTQFNNFASDICFNTDVRFNSQSLIACMTTTQVLGGRGWPNLLFNSDLSKIEECKKATILWLNSSFGILQYWNLAQKQQSGRGIMPHSLFQHMHTLNVKALNSQQLDKISNLFDDIASKEFLPIYLVDQDQHRAKLDEELLSIVIDRSLNNDEITGLAKIRKLIPFERTIAGGKIYDEIKELKINISLDVNKNYSEYFLSKSNKKMYKIKTKEEKIEKTKKKKMKMFVDLTLQLEHPTQKKDTIDITAEIHETKDESKNVIKSAIAKPKLNLTNMGRYKFQILDKDKKPLEHILGQNRKNTNIISYVLISK